jgi:hypothetical protein
LLVEAVVVEATELLVEAELVVWFTQLANLSLPETTP